MRRAANRAERAVAITYIYSLCIAAVIIPALLVFIGVSLTVLIAPLIFMALSVLFLLPVLLSGKAENKGEIVYE